MPTFTEEDFDALARLAVGREVKIDLDAQASRRRRELHDGRTGTIVRTIKDPVGLTRFCLVVQTGCGEEVAVEPHELALLTNDDT